MWRNSANITPIEVPGSRPATWMYWTSMPLNHWWSDRVFNERIILYLSLPILSSPKRNKIWCFPKNKIKWSTYRLHAMKLYRDTLVTNSHQFPLWFFSCTGQILKKLRKYTELKRYDCSLVFDNELIPCWCDIYCI